MDLGYNRILAVPENYRELYPRLVELDVRYNQITGTLPPTSHATLQVLIAPNNKIETLNTHALVNCACLDTVDVENNSISALDPRLGVLSLRFFGVKGNTFRMPRWSIVMAGTESVLSYLRDRIV